MVKSKKINVGISIGDPNGIGIEVMLKALYERRFNDNCNYIIYSSYELIVNQKKDTLINLKRQIDDTFKDHENLKKNFEQNKLKQLFNETIKILDELTEDKINNYKRDEKEKINVSSDIDEIITEIGKKM